MQLLVAANPCLALTDEDHVGFAAVVVGAEVNPLVRKTLAENPRTPMQALFYMVHIAEPDVRVRLAIAKNPNTPLETLNTLRMNRNEDLKVRSAGTKNFNSRTKYQG